MWTTQTVVVVVVMVVVSSPITKQVQLVEEEIVWEDQVHTPVCVKHANSLFGRVQGTIIEEMTAVKNELIPISESVVIVHADVNKQTELIEIQLSQLREELQTTETHLGEALTKITALENALQEKTEQLAKTEDLEALNDSLSLKLEVTHQSIVTKAEIQELLDDNLKKVLQAVTDARQTCESDAILTEVLQGLTEVKERVEEVANMTEATKEEAKRCTEEGVAQVGDVQTEVAAVKERIQDLDTDVESTYEELQEMVVEILNFTRLPPPTPPPTTTTTTTTPEPGTVFPCEDSTFKGTNAISVCQSAVRFKKCHLQSVAYHCCHTCTSQNQLPEMGSWRYMNEERVVSTLNVLRFFTP